MDFLDERRRLENWTRRKEIEVYERWERMTGTTINFPGKISFGTAVALRPKLYYSRYTENSDAPDMFAEIKQRFLDTWSVYRSPQPATCILSHFCFVYTEILIGHANMDIPILFIPHGEQSLRSYSL